MENCDMLDPQDQIEVLVKVYSTVRKVHPADLSRSDGFYTSSDAGNAERQYVVQIVQPAIVTAARRSAVSSSACLA
jgi:predicted ATP-dependent protease